MLDAKPAGLVVTFEVLAGTTWQALADDGFASMAELYDYFDSAADMAAYVPGTRS